MPYSKTKHTKEEIKKLRADVLRRYAKKHQDKMEDCAKFAVKDLAPISIIATIPEKYEAAYVTNATWELGCLMMI